MPEKNITRGKAAIIKAWLLRNVVQAYDQRNEKHVYEEVLTVELNEQTTYLPYRLGRLFAVMEKIQKEANPTSTQRSRIAISIPLVQRLRLFSRRW